MTETASERDLTEELQALLSEGEEEALAIFLRLVRPEDIAEWLDLPAEEVMPTLGTSQALWLACVAHVRPGDVVLVEQPTYEPLRKVPARLGARVLPMARPVDLGRRLDVGPLRERLAETGARFTHHSSIAPTGTTDGAQFFEYFRKTLSYDRLSGAMRGSRRLLDDAILVRCFQGFIDLANHYSAVNPDADGGRRQRRGVVDAVADHRNCRAAALPHRLELVFGRRASP